jgi:hypothetical protein
MHISGASKRGRNCNSKDQRPDPPLACGMVERERDIIERAVLVISEQATKAGI